MLFSVGPSFDAEPSDSFLGSRTVPPRELSTQIGVARSHLLTQGCRPGREHPAETLTFSISHVSVFVVLLRATLSSQVDFFHSNSSASMTTAAAASARRCSGGFFMVLAFLRHSARPDVRAFHSDFSSQKSAVSCQITT